MKTIYERLDAILPRVTDPDFRKNKGRGNEINSHVFDYMPKDELLVRDRIQLIKNKAQSMHGIHIVEFDLYEIILEILESKGYLKKNFEMEQKKGTTPVIDATKKALRLTLNNDLLVNYIRDRLEGADMIFLTGVGKAWPIIRSHTILNNLHAVVKDQPLIMFFPGHYDGGTLMLFNEFKDDHYYRAFKLIDCY